MPPAFEAELCDTASESTMVGCALNKPDVRWGNSDRHEDILLRENVGRPVRLKRDLIERWLTKELLKSPSRVSIYWSPPLQLIKPRILYPSGTVRS
jgi:hypothetical protein